MCRLNLQTSFALLCLLGIGTENVFLGVANAKTRTIATDTYTKDLLAVQIKSRLWYTIDAGRLSVLRQTYGDHFEPLLIDAAVRAAIREIIAEYDTDRLVLLRAHIAETIKGRLADWLHTQHHIHVDDFIVAKFSFPKRYQRAVKEKTKAMKAYERALQRQTQ